MLVAAMNVTLFAFAVMAAAIGSLDDASRASGRLVAMMPSLGGVEVDRHEHDQRGNEEQGAPHVERVDC